MRNQGSATAHVAGRDRADFTAPVEVRWAGPPPPPRKGFEWPEPTPASAEFWKNARKGRTVTTTTHGHVYDHTDAADKFDPPPAAIELDDDQELDDAGYDEETDQNHSGEPPAPEPREPEPQPQEPTQPIAAEPIDEWASLLRETALSRDPLVVAARINVQTALAVLEQAAHPVPTPTQPRLEQATTPEPPAPRPRPSGRPRGSAINITRAKQLYVDGHTCPDIGQQLGHTPGTIRKALKAAGVPMRDDRATRSGGQAKTYDPQLVDQVRRLYLEEQMSQQRVADQLGLTLKIVQTIMARHQIPAREGQSGGGDTLVGIKTRLAQLGVTSADVKRWAFEQGHIAEINRGVCPRRLVDAYEAAHTTEQEAS